MYSVRCTSRAQTSPCKRGPSCRFSPLSPLPSFPWRGRNHPCRYKATVSLPFTGTPYTPLLIKRTHQRNQPTSNAPHPARNPSSNIIRAFPRPRSQLSAPFPPPSSASHTFTSPSSDFARPSPTSRTGRTSSRKKKACSPNVRSQQIGPAAARPTRGALTVDDKHPSPSLLYSVLLLPPAPLPFPPFSRYPSDNIASHICAPVSDSTQPRTGFTRLPSHSDSGCSTPAQRTSTAF